MFPLKIEQAQEMQTSLEKVREIQQNRAAKQQDQTETSRNHHHNTQSLIDMESNFSTGLTSSFADKVEESANVGVDSLLLTLMQLNAAITPGECLFNFDCESRCVCVCVIFFM
jgi:flagellar motor switch protein FliM